ncbi:MAG: hypothetical protein JWR19_4072 [Pedosphaera sp.]|nr:hypothetical protein [Pedosphaera sp.]
MAVVVGLATQAMAEGAAPLTAWITQLKGQARYSSDGKTWLPLKQGDDIKAGYLIQTAAKSAVEIQLGEQEAKSGVMAAGTNALHLFQNSVLSVDKLTSEQAETNGTGETMLDLRAGQMAGNTRQLPAGYKFEIKFPSGVAGVRGTTSFVINAAGGVKVQSGEVVVAKVAADGSVTSQVVTANHGTSLDTGPSTGAP